MGVSIEAHPIHATEIRIRSKRLLKILDANGVDIDKDAYNTAVEYYAKKEQPRTVFTHAIAFGTGQRDISELREPEEDDTEDKEQGDETTDTESQPELTPLEKLAMGPVKENVIDDIKDESVLNQVAVLETPAADIYYLINPHKFKADYGLENIGDHSAAAVGSAAVQYNSFSFGQMQTSRIQRWVDQVEDGFAKHILSAAVLHWAPRTRPIDPNPQDSFRSESFWPVVKRGVAQPVLSNIQQQDDDTVDTFDIAEGTGFDEEVVRRVLYVLYENETVKPRDGGWAYIEDSRFRTEQVPDE